MGTASPSPGLEVRLRCQGWAGEKGARSGRPNRPPSEREGQTNFEIKKDSLTLASLMGYKAICWNRLEARRLVAKFQSMMKMEARAD